MISMRTIKSKFLHIYINARNDVIFLRGSYPKCMKKSKFYRNIVILERTEGREGRGLFSNILASEDFRCLYVTILLSLSHFCFSCKVYSKFSSSKIYLIEFNTYSNNIHYKNLKFFAL